MTSAIKEGDQHFQVRPRPLAFAVVRAIDPQLDPRNVRPCTYRVIVNETEQARFGLLHTAFCSRCSPESPLFDLG